MCVSVVQYGVLYHIRCAHIYSAHVTVEAILGALRLGLPSPLSALSSGKSAQTVKVGGNLGSLLKWHMFFVGKYIFPKIRHFSILLSRETGSAARRIRSRRDGGRPSPSESWGKACGSLRACAAARACVIICSIRRHVSARVPTFAYI